LNRGMAYLEQGKLEKAGEDIKKALDSFPNQYQTNYGMAKYYEKKGDKKKAVEYYKKSLQIAKESRFVGKHIQNSIEDMENKIRTLQQK
ncbi:MAG: tetratricopeptide repeat protein, partial [Firmicutes bacterium]|nr:tetratricopeptide repeat protein [Bacillota bacterium]